MSKTIGFIGLGIMGKPMAKHLINAGYPLVVYNRTTSKAQDLVAMGARQAGSPKEVAENSEIIITMVADSPEVEAVVLGTAGVIEGVKAGSIVIDMSSISPIVTQKIAAELAKRKVAMLDAPVSGGEVGAIQATLSIMVGGDEPVFAEMKPVLEKMGKSVVRVGAVGAGGFTKLSNQIIVAAALQAISEAMVLAKKAGVDMSLVYEAIKSGMAGGRTLDMKAAKLVERNFEAGFKIDLHIKDLKNALQAGKALGVPLPATGLIHELFNACSAQGKGHKDHSVIFTLIEQMAGI
ncbi:MAG: 2-hydroxy-3-oxopropionate reductase [Acidobacteria bacterium]|nr:2-hydroxy-3-oxopropionate reductase [Acidobacteriota bacterium]MCI0626802.1 2-hydroxy-3-oxopropionate reductase [Acidobacteriota bacterium]